MSAVGLLLVLVGATLVVAEAHVPSHGALGTAAAAALAAGIGLLVSGAGLGAAAVAGATLTAALVSLALVPGGRAQGLATRRRACAAARRPGRPRRRGPRGARARRPRARGRRAVARPPVGPRGEPDLRPGDPVVIERVSGLTLTVRPAEEWEVAP